MEIPLFISPRCGNCLLIPVLSIFYFFPQFTEHIYILFASVLNSLRMLVFDWCMTVTSESCPNMRGQINGTDTIWIWVGEEQNKFNPGSYVAHWNKRWTQNLKRSKTEKHVLTDITMFTETLNFLDHCVYTGLLLIIFSQWRY